MIASRLPVAVLIFSGALIAQAIAIALYYEVFAWATAKAPTISAITAAQLVAHPRWFLVGLAVFFFVAGALVTHFTHWTP